MGTDRVEQTTDSQLEFTQTYWTDGSEVQNHTVNTTADTFSHGMFIACVCVSVYLCACSHSNQTNVFQVKGLTVWTKVPATHTHTHTHTV